MGHNARKFMVENYDSDKIFKELWYPYLENLENEVYPSVEKESK